MSGFVGVTGYLKGLAGRLGARRGRSSAQCISAPKGRPALTRLLERVLKLVWRDWEAQPMALGDGDELAQIGIFW